MIEHAPHVFLALRIPIDLNITFPQFCPGVFMKLQQPFSSFQFCKDGHPLRFIERIIMMRRGDG